uniref:E3 ubiquitin-protein ligase n=1 Tax=Lutzomyia longipalpis TaxID=7200 RepID=A0A1B0CHT4_LUTLO
MTSWWQYDVRTSQEIEEAYARKEKTCTILVAGYLYCVDFESMIQIRQDDPSRRRRVKLLQSQSTLSDNIDCPICLQSCIHPTRLPCGHIFCFLCVKGVASKNRRCALCRRDIPAECLEHPELVRGVQDLSTSAGSEIRWFYEGRNGGWWEYEVRTREELEVNYKLGVLSMTTIICGNAYEIDFQQMVQYPKDHPRRKRRIRREGPEPELWVRWWQYDVRTSQEIEEAYARKEKTCTILVAGYLYCVDFESMIQIRQDDPSRRRRVKRDLASVPKKGVAGLRIDSNNVVVTDATPTTSEITTSEPVPISANPNPASSHTATDAALRIASHLLDSMLTQSDDYQSSDETSRDISQEIFDDSGDLLEGIRNLTLRNFGEESSDTDSDLEIGH